VRIEFVKAVEAAIDADPASMFITGDLGFNALEGMQARFGARFVNAGVAEQSMMGIAAGAALAGRRPWVYSIAPFATYRCLEQIRNDVCLHRLPVRIAGNGGGFTYGIMGSTHHALEDLAVLKVLPNIQLYFPCANDHVAAAVRAVAALDGPSYLRLAISAFSTERAALVEHPVTLTRTYTRRSAPGRRGATVIGAGHGVQVALRALASHGLDAENVDVFGVARFPFDLAADGELLESARQTRRVVFVEEHYAAGGMGESMLRALPPLDSFTLIAPAYAPDQRYGSPAFHMRQSGVTPEALVAAVQAVRRAS
jgi:transketolase